MLASNRRQFLQTTATGTLATLATGIATADSNSRIPVGVIGPGGMGMNHVRLLSARKDVEIRTVCDVDQNRAAAAAEHVANATGKKPTIVGDMRKLLEDPEIAAVWIATPDHWHAPAALLALKAGKHVYVEKPMCHNLHEGRLLVDAVKATGKVLQVGTQSRSGAAIQEAIQRLREGQIGEILVAKAWNSQRRGSIGKTQPSTPPAHLDFETWLGPAPAVPYRTNLLHGVWRWWYDFGCGDIGNDGVHDIDVACWGLGVTTHPSRISCLGGKYFFDDDQQFPDTQYAIFEYPEEGKKTRQLIFEQRIWSPYVQEGYENGVAYYGTNGMKILGHSVSWKMYGPRNKLLAEKEGGADLPAHHQNFLECVRANKQATNADAMAGHLAAGLVHLANIAARTGQVLHFDPQAERVTNSPEADALVRRKYRDHWGTPKG